MTSDTRSNSKTPPEGTQAAGRKLHILHVHTLPIISGSGINTLLTMKGSLQAGHRVGLACESAGRLTREAEETGIAVHHVPELGRELRPWRDMLAILKLAVLMRRHRYALVHTHNSKAGFVGRRAARLAGVPTVIHTVHGFAFHDAEPRWRRALFRSMERLAARWCDGMIFISAPLWEWAHREGIGRKVPQTIIYSGIDTVAFRNATGVGLRQEWGIQADRLVVGMVSKLWEGKGHDTLLHAWKGVQECGRVSPPPLLLIVGEGHLEGKLKTLVADLRLGESVRFVGFQSNIPEVTAALDLSVLPSLFEGMGRVVLEAMAAGKPIIASRVGGIPDLVSHGQTGLLVAPGHSEELREALVRLLTDGPLRTSMGELARSSLQPEYTSEHMVRQIHQFYDRVVSGWNLGH